MLLKQKMPNQSGVLLLAHLVPFQCVFAQYIKNVKLLFLLNYKDLLKFIVCDLDNKECIVKRSPQCPATIDPLIEHLKTVMGECEEDNVIKFSQWTTPDRSTLV